jgi:hypothetical protein
LGPFVRVADEAVLRQQLDDGLDAGLHVPGALRRVAVI